MAVTINHITLVDGRATICRHKAETTMGWCVDNLGAGLHPFKVYRGEIAEENEVTTDFDVLKSHSGEFSVLETPGGPVVPYLVVSLVVAVAVVLLTPKPKMPDLPQPNIDRSQQSPNNRLSALRNEVRINQRIPDIVGRVRSVPDVIMQPYTKFNGTTEEEYNYFCVARGEPFITDLRDSGSLISQLAGYSAGVYGANKSPLNASPDSQVGANITESIARVTKAETVAGISLPGADEKNIVLSNGSITAGVISGGTIGVIDDPQIEYYFDTIYNAGDEIKILNANSGGAWLVGIYKITVITTTRIQLDVVNPPAPALNNWVNITPNFSLINDVYLTARLTPNGINYSEWQPITNIKVDKIWVNVVADGGLFATKADGSRVGTVCEFYVEYQLLDDNFSPIGIITTTLASISGATATRTGKTIEIQLPVLSYVRVRIGKKTNTKSTEFGLPLPPGESLQNVIKWEGLYGSAPAGVSHFGDVTTIHLKRSNQTSIQGGGSSSNLFTCTATEALNEYQGAGVFAPTKTPNQKAMQSLIRVALDPKIGNRAQSEMNLDAILATQTEIETYFNNTGAGECSYTFDSTDTTPQEIFSVICNAVFSTPMRTGRVFDVFFEKPQTLPNMVFTHRSKKPDSEVWGRTWNNENRYDGIELSYFKGVSPEPETYFYPENRSAKNPMKLEVPGIRNEQQAIWKARREYQKLIYQKESVDFTATAEGRFVKPLQLISVVKGARVYTTDGYIISVNGLVLELSQEVTFGSGDHSIILKKRDGSIESIICTAGTTSRHVVLSSPPTEAIYTGEDELKTEFSFGSESRLAAQEMIPQVIDVSEKRYVKIKAVNYDSRYYIFDPVQTVLSAFDSGFDSGFG